MKNVLTLFSAVLTLFLFSCGSVDQEMVKNMQNDLTTYEGYAASLEEAGKSVTTLASALATVPESIKKAPTPEFNELSIRTTGMSDKYTATQAEYNDMLNRLKTIIADYSAGKIKKEDAQKEYETIKASLDHLPGLIGRLKDRADQMQANFARQSATWNAEKENSK